MGSGRRAGFEPATLGFGMSSGGSGSFALARVVSGVLARVNDRMLTLCGVRRISSLTNIPICSQMSMGREGFEPSTLGLRVDARALVATGDYSLQGSVERKHLGSHGVLSHGLVDLLLTHSVVPADNDV